MKASKITSNNIMEVSIIAGIFIFATAALTACAKATTSLEGREKSRAECINIVIDAARNLKGAQFARDVAANLSSWVDKENGLD